MDPTAVVEAGVTLGTALVTVTVLGGLEIEKIVVKHVEAARLAEIADVQTIFDQTYKTINIPPFFSGTPLTGSFLTVETLNKIAATTPLFDNKKTDQCVRHIINAINYLVEWHGNRLSRTNALGRHEGKVDDVTSSTISNLILLLSENCVKFTDTTLVLSYLNQTIEFVRRFAGFKQYESYRKVSLTQVLSELEIAVFLLNSHRLSLSITERVKQLLTVTDDATIQLLMNAAKLVVKNKDWRLMETFIPQRLEKGLLRYKLHYQEEGLGIKIWKTEAAIGLHKSILSRWIVKNCKDYLLALSLEDAPEDKGNFINLSEFNVPNLQPVQDELLAHFRESNNFMTLTSKQNDGTNAANQLVTINASLLEERVAFFAGMMHLLHCLNILRYFCAHFRDCITEFGERRYKKFPHDTVFMFGVIRDFRNELNNYTQRLGVDLDRIVSSQHNAMLTEKLGSGILNVIKNILSNVIGRVCQELDNLVEWHNNNLLHHHPRPKVPLSAQKVNIHSTDHMLVIAHRIATAFKFSIHENVSLDVAPPPPPMDDLSQTYLKIADINHRITALQQKPDTPTQDVQHYREACTALLYLLAHTIDIGFEQAPARQRKAQQIMALIVNYADELQKYLAKTVPDREIDAAAFANRIRLSANNPANHIIDQRKPWTICFWQTESRKRLQHLVQACEKVARLRS